MAEILLYAAGVLVFVLALGVSIALHEAGHLYFAKRYGVRVTQYMVGFGPTLWSCKKGETEYGVKAVPLGGFVKMIGMLPPGTKEQERIAAGLGPSRAERKAREALAKSGAASTASKDAELVRGSSTGMFTSIVSATRAGEFELVEPEDAKRLFYRLPAGKKATIMAAGPAVNVVLAFLLFWAGLGIYGERTTQPTGSTVVASVAECAVPNGTGREACAAGYPASPANLMGLRVGDRILSFNGRAVSTWNEMTALVHADQTGRFSVVVERDGRRIELGPVPAAKRAATDERGRPVQGQQVGYLGVGPESALVVRHLGPVEVLGKMKGYVVSTAQSIVNLPARTWGVLLALSGAQERAADSPVSVVGGSRVAGEIAVSDAPGLDVGGKLYLLAMMVGSFNLFIGLFNLVPLMPLDGGHIAGSLWEMLKRALARVRGAAMPKPVDVGKQLPVAVGLVMAFAVMTVILVLADIVVPLKTGL